MQSSKLYTKHRTVYAEKLMFLSCEDLVAKVWHVYDQESYVTIIFNKFKRYFWNVHLQWQGCRISIIIRLTVANFAFSRL